MVVAILINTMTPSKGIGLLGTLEPEEFILLSLFIITPTHKLSDVPLTDGFSGAT